MGHFELPLPRPEGEPLTMVLANVDSFAEEWSLPKDSIRLWVCLSDVAHAQILAIPHVRARITDLLGAVRLELQLRPGRHGATDAGARGTRPARRG